jgi:hypothetical protein
MFQLTFRKSLPKVYKSIREKKPKTKYSWIHERVLCNAVFNKKISKHWSRYTVPSGNESGKKDKLSAELLTSWVGAVEVGIESLVAELLHLLHIVGQQVIQKLLQRALQLCPNSFAMLLWALVPMLIRIQHFTSIRNWIRMIGFEDQKLKNVTAEKILFFFFKIYNLFIPSRPQWRTSKLLEKPSALNNIRILKQAMSSLFCIFVGHFCPTKPKSGFAFHPVD